MTSVAGLDVSKEWIDCMSNQEVELRRFQNKARGHLRLVKYLKERQTKLVVAEATGGYEQAVFRVLWASELPTALVNPRQTRAFAHSLGRRARNDMLDAEVNMRFAERVQPRPTMPDSADVQELRSLLTRRQQLTKMLVGEKNHRASPELNTTAKRSVTAVLKVLQTQIKNIDKNILSIIQNSPQLAPKAERLRQETGVGPVLMSTILAEMPELGTLTRNEASALVGVAPYDRDSGSIHGKRSIAGGRVKVRCALYMATLAAIRHNTHLKTFYQRLLSTGKPRKVAIVACMRKFIIRLNTILKQNVSQHFIAAKA